MNRTISSAWTAFYKFIFAPFWIGFFGLGTIGLLWQGHPWKWRFLAAWVVGTFFLMWLCLPLKRVTLEGSEMVVSNFLRSIRVPLDQIRDVTENVLINIHPVWICFREPTEFGPKILFMPKVRMFSLFGSHPVVAELKSLARQAWSATEAADRP